MDARTYNGISPQRFLEIAIEAKTQTGLRIEGHQGQATAHGITVEWDYNAATNVLILQCLAKPFFISNGLLNGKLDALVEGERIVSNS